MPKLIEIDYEIVEELAKIHCTEGEIAKIIGVCPNTFTKRKRTDKRLQEVLAKGESEGKSSLRRLQYQKAMGGSVTMLIWLGKQWLGQLDEPIQENDNESLDNLIKVLGTIRNGIKTE